MTSCLVSTAESWIYDVKTPANAGVLICGGETGIRTPVSFNPEHAFQACDLNHSSISPFTSQTAMQTSPPLCLKQ
jgi:hypothetical protein